MFDTTNPFGQSSSSPFASQSVFGQTNNVSSNRFAPKPSFSSPTPFGSQTGGSIFGGTSTGVFGAAQSSSPFSSTTAFGASSSPAFGSSMPGFGSSSTPTVGSSSSSFGGSSVFGQKHAFGFGSTPTQSSPFGSTTQQSQPTIGSGIFGSSTAFGSTQSAFGSNTPAFGAFDAASTPIFGATSTTAFGATSTSAFGATSTSAFGSTRSPAFESIGTTFGVSNATVFGTGGTFGASSTPAFGTSNTPTFGASSTPSFSFGSSPAFGQSMPSFVCSPFGTAIIGAQSSPFGNQSSTSAFGSTSFGQSPFRSQCRGSRVAPYTPTTEADSESGKEPTAKLESISAMPVYKDKSHEELRWEDYQLGDKDGPQPAAQPSGGIGFGVSTAPTSPFGSSHTSHQSKKKCASSLKEKEFVVDDDIESYNDKCDDESNGEYFLDQGDFADVNEVDEVKVEVEADVAIFGVENIQDENSRSLVDIDSDDVFSDVVNDDIQNAQLVQTQPVQTTVVSDVALHVSSSSVPMHNDAASASGNFGACSDSTSTKVDFHGFSVLSQYVKYLENIYLKEGEFWNTCIFKSVDFISCTLDILGKALLIADAPWSNISPKKLCLMLQIMDDVIKAGFKLECVGTCTSRAKALLSIEVNKTELEAEMKEVTGKIVLLQKELELQKNREAELQKQLEALSQFDSTGSSPWSYIVG